MDYVIVDKPAFQIVGKAIRVPMKDNENMRIIPEFWDKSIAEGLLDTLISIEKSDGVFDGATLGICTDFASDMSEFTYLIAAEKGDEAVATSLTEIDVPALAWATFKGTGAMPTAIQDVWGFVMGEFLPNSGYAHAAGPDIEVYPPGNPDAADYKFEVWVPVVKK